MAQAFDITRPDLLPNPSVPLTVPTGTMSTALRLTNANPMTMPDARPPDVVPLGNLEPVPLVDANGNPPLILQFPSTTNFMSASFKATLAAGHIYAMEGCTFVVDLAISLPHLPSSESALVAGVDTGLITTEPPAAIPEPAT
jgi:hypothetical protein